MCGPGFFFVSCVPYHAFGFGFAAPLSVHILFLSRVLALYAPLRQRRVIIGDCVCRAVYVRVVVCHRCVRDVRRACVGEGLVFASQEESGREMRKLISERRPFVFVLYFLFLGGHVIRPIDRVFPFPLFASLHIHARREEKLGKKEA